MPDKYDWKTWFAWYPVAFGPFIVWFKTIQRRYDENGDVWYRHVPANPNSRTFNHRRQRILRWFRQNPQQYPQRNR
jgi:hypothetical protein